MRFDYDPSVSPKAVFYKTIEVDGLKIAYREAGDAKSPKIVLLHGFPSSSHQYRDLMRELAGSFHVISPDYPGFGNSDMPDPKSFAYTFDNTAAIVTKFLEKVGFTRSVSTSRITAARLVSVFSINIQTGLSG